MLVFGYQAIAFDGYQTKAFLINYIIVSETLSLVMRLPGN